MVTLILCIYALQIRISVYNDASLVSHTFFYVYTENPWIRLLILNMRQFKFKITYANIRPQKKRNVFLNVSESFMYIFTKKNTLNLINRWRVSHAYTK